MGSLAIVLAACTTGAPESPVVSAATTPQPPSPTDTIAGTAPGGTSPTASPVRSAAAATVTIRNRSFGTPEITVAVGIVTFVNEDTVAHTVSEGENGNLAPNARFNVVVAPGDSVHITFGAPGDYQITCLFHSEMHLLIHAR